MVSWLSLRGENQRCQISYQEMFIPNYNIFRQDRTSKGGRVSIYCRDSLQRSAILSRSVPKQFELLVLKTHLSRNKSLKVAACYRAPSAPSCALDTICELFAPHLSSELVLLGDLNWDMLNTPAVLQSKLDALNLTQIINEPTSTTPIRKHGHPHRYPNQPALQIHLCCLQPGSQRSLPYFLCP